MEHIRAICEPHSIFIFSAFLESNLSLSLLQLITGIFFALQQFHRAGFVLVLRALILTRYRNTRWNVGDLNR